MTGPTRRAFAALSALAALPLTAAHAAAAIPTPRATEGPYYPSEDMRFTDVDNDLVKIEGVVKDAGGEVLRLSGKVMTRDGAPAAGAVVEIWQCDANGRYLHTGERSAQPRDSAFQGFGRTVADDTGRYTFRTIKPVAYPGRTPHIHVKAIYGGRVLTTQFYLAGHRQNEGDSLYRRLDAAERGAVEMILNAEAGGLQTTRDIVL